MKKWKELVNKDMLRPWIYKVFTRGILALFAAQLAHHFLPESWPLKRFSSLSLALGLLFALAAFLAWLRMDGLKIPQMKLPRMKKKDPPFLQGSMADHIDDEITTFDDLDEDEQNLCVFLADLPLCVVCLILAAVL